jgi:hypothetical protein
MKCPHCGTQVPDHSRSCPVCEHDIDFPNVRAAAKAEEIEALDMRYQNAHNATKQRQVDAILDLFENAVRASKAVLCRDWGVANRLLSSDNELFATFAQLVHAGARLPEDNEFDPARPGVDGTMFPYFSHEIRFAALSLDERGVAGYGGCSIVLKEEIVAHRATVFEENSLVFCQRLQVVAGGKVPFGYRASWGERHRLAGAKLHQNLRATTQPIEYPTILLGQPGERGSRDFIEVHIYGSLHRRGVERVIGPEPTEEEDKVIVRALRRKLAEIDVELVIG